MYIEEIKWLDKQEKEAMLKVVSGGESLKCFSYPCSYNVGDILIEPLECLDTDNIVLCETQGNSIEKMEGAFKYRLKGELKDTKDGIVKVYDFKLHIDEGKIPKDIMNGMYVQFVVSRIDVW